MRLPDQSQRLRTRLHTVLLSSALLSSIACGSSDVTEQKSNAGGNAAAGNAGMPGNAIGGFNAASGAGGVGSGGVSGTAGGGSGAGTAGGGAGGTAGQATGPDCAPPTDVFSPVTQLSKTGCVDAADPKKPVARAIAYDVNSPLWSDSADKTRAFVLPAGAKIHVASDGHWDFPVGTAMLKTFAFDAKLVETRLFMRVDADNWVGYSYQWNEAQTDATIVSADGTDAMFNTGQRVVAWHYPSQKDCLNCHNAGGGSTLGPETAQMNRMRSGTNQIDQLSALGVFDTPPSAPYAKALIAPYPSQAGSPPGDATAEQKARSYLHANCSFCHRPGGNYTNFDFRYGTAFKDMNICNAEAKKGAIASAPGKTTILVPGQAADSVMWLRMNEPDPEKGRMPQVASYVVDHDAVTLVQDWIKTIAACP
jgi:uncharacterized repeat protein (TIGR03806 family)